MHSHQALKGNEPLKRSVDTLQRILAVIAALAVGQALRSAFQGSPIAELDVSGGSAAGLHLSAPHLALAAALIVTAIPFVHGMNRHLDEHIAELASQHERRQHLIVMLLIDFLVFTLECCLLLALAFTVTDAMETFLIVLCLLLAVDVVWAVPRTVIELGVLDGAKRQAGMEEAGEESTWTQVRSRLKWAAINLVTGLVLLAMYFSLLPIAATAWTIAVVAFLRTVADYWLGRDEYFPKHAEGPALSSP